MTAPLPRASGSETLALRARRMADGVRFGLHASRMAGAGLEFSQFRSYQPGDDPRRVDWKLFARSDRYFIRQSETETALAVRLVLDASASMAHTEHGTSRFGYARELVATLAWIALAQGDTVQLLLPGGTGVATTPLLRGTRRFDAIVTLVESAQPHGGLPPWDAIARRMTAPGRGITIVLSDGHDETGRLRELLVRLARGGEDARLLLIEAPDERGFTYRGLVTLEDLETGEEVVVRGEDLRSRASQALAERRASLSAALAASGAAFGTVLLGEPPSDALRRFLAATQA